MPVNIGDFPVGVLTKGLQVVFNEAYENALKSSLRSLVALETGSDSDSEDYAWLGAVPKVREFIGAREARTLANFSYNIKNKEWENTIGVKRSTISDQKFDMINMRIRQLAEEAVRYQDELVFSFLLGALGSAAAPYLCYDGQGFFDTDHPAPNIVGGAVQANKVTLELTFANLWLQVNRMRLFQDDQGRYLSLSPDLLLVEPCLENLAWELCNSTYNVNTASANIAFQNNSLKALNIRPVATPYLYSTATVANANWILCSTQGLIKPVIFQMREAVSFKAMEENSDAGFTRNEYQYGTYARYNVGAGFWAAAIGSSGAA